MKNINLHTQKIQKISRRINLKRSTPRHIIVKWWKVKGKENPESIRRKMTHHICEILNKIKGRYLIRSYGGHKAVGWHIKDAKRKRSMKIFQQNHASKVKEILTHSHINKNWAFVGNRPSLQEKLIEVSQTKMKGH